MKIKQLISSLMLVLCICTAPVLAQSIDEKDIIGTWEIQGVLMGDDGSGWLMPHKHASPDCKDHSVFLDDHSGKEVKHQEDCEAAERDFTWEINEDVLTLTQGERSIKWHIASIEEDILTVGVQMRADSEKRMYVKYKKLEEPSKSEDQ